MAVNVEIKVVASIYVFSADPDFDSPAFDGTIEEFFSRSKEPVQRLIKEYLGKELLASYWNGILRILQYTVAGDVGEP